MHIVAGVSYYYYYFFFWGGGGGVSLSLSFFFEGGVCELQQCSGSLVI